MELPKLSNIGFGTYRTTFRIKEHKEALSYALNSGCCLVDTASNYLDGESERLVGMEAGSATGFIISKAGYISASTINQLQKFHKKSIKLKDLVKINESINHSIHPDFLRAQIDLSLKRLKRKSMNGFLLHNPEYFLEHMPKNLAVDVIYQRLYKAFEFLQEMVHVGKIQFYGISSNTLPHEDTFPHVISLPKVVALSKQVSQNNSFKLVQFPFNLFEDAAVTKKHSLNKSLLDLLRENNIRSISNRPLNANGPDGATRLVIFDVSSFEDNNIEQKVNETLELFHRQLVKLNRENEFHEFPIVQLLTHHQNSFDSVAVIEKVFKPKYWLFIKALYRNHVPNSNKRIFDETYKVIEGAAKKNHNTKIKKFAKTIINAEDFESSPLQTHLCRHYLRLGINHVLVGMTKKQYVKDMQPLFNFC